MLLTGSKAPDFTLNDKNGNKVSLSDLKGKRVVLYFYSKDNTSGCTKQACAFAEHYHEFEELGIEVIGVSRDSAESHKRFAEKYSLPFNLLSDPELDVIKKYGVWQEKNNYGKKVMGIVRSTFIIDAEGTIEHIMSNVQAARNPSDVLKLLNSR